MSTTQPAGERPVISDMYLMQTMLPMEAVMEMFGTEPQPVYRRLAEQCPMMERAPGIYTALTMKDVLEINRHRSVIGNGSCEASMGGAHKLIPLDIDGPEHTHFRKILDPVFTPKKMALLEPKVRALADRLIDGFVNDGQTELFGAFCQPLPSMMFLSIMGLPESDLPYFMEFKNGILHHDAETDPTAAQAIREAAGNRCREYFTKLWDERHASGEHGDDVLGWLIDSNVDGQSLTREQFVEINLLLMIAGLDTVSASLSCLLSWLARHPTERHWILEDTARWPQAIEELMRFESPVPQGFRQAVEDIEVNGTTYPAGTRFIVSWPSANLDPEVFTNPLEVDLERAVNPHVVFASGWHRCLGSHLARMELRVALDQFHRRIPDYEIAEGTTLQYLPLGVRQVMNLPIVWSA